MSGEKTQFEARLAIAPADAWKPIAAITATEAAEAYVADFERSIQRWEIAQSRRHLLVVVRDPANPAIVACYRVTGRLEPRYTAALELPGAPIAAQGGG